MQLWLEGGFTAVTRTARQRENIAWLEAAEERSFSNRFVLGGRDW